MTDAAPIGRRGTDAGTAPDPGEDVDRIADAVLGVAGVAGLHPGLFGEVGSYLPGRRVPGIRVREDGSVDVHVVVEWRAPVPETADAIRRAVTAVHPGEVDVTIADLATGEPGADGWKGEERS